MYSNYMSTMCEQYRFVFFYLFSIIRRVPSSHHLKKKKRLLNIFFSLVKSVFSLWNYKCFAYQPFISLHLWFIIILTVHRFCTTFEQPSLLQDHYNYYIMISCLFVFAICYFYAFHLSLQIIIVNSIPCRINISWFCDNYHHYC